MDRRSRESKDSPAHQRSRLRRDARLIAPRYLDRLRVRSERQLGPMGDGCQRRYARATDLRSRRRHPP
jgi:hypothetical protein